MRMRTRKQRNLRKAVRQHCHKYRIIQADLDYRARIQYALFIARLIGELRYIMGDCLPPEKNNQGSQHDALLKSFTVNQILTKND